MLCWCQSHVLDASGSPVRPARGPIRGDGNRNTGFRLGTRADGLSLRVEPGHRMREVEDEIRSGMTGLIERTRRCRRARNFVLQP